MFKRCGTFCKPWCFLSFIIFVVVGPKYTKLATAVANIVAIGANTLFLFCAAKTPLYPESILREVVWPGKVRTRRAGSAVCMVKYIGKMFCWSVENCGLGRHLKAITPPMKDYALLDTLRMIASHTYLEDLRTKTRAIPDSGQFREW